MKKITLIIIFVTLAAYSFAQNQIEAEKLVAEGIALHDNGNYDDAILKYEKALELDKDNILAMSEKSITLSIQKKYDEAISYCQKIIAIHKDKPELALVYVVCGNAYDELKFDNKSIEMYDEGIYKFPNSYLLYFNKGIALSKLKKYDDAELCFQKSVMLNPKHAGSHNALAWTNVDKNKRVPALLAFCTFLSIEPQSDRAKRNFLGMQKIINGNIEVTGEKSITINISTEIINDTSANATPKENNFVITDMTLTLDAALDYHKKNKKKSEIDKFIHKFKTLCTSLEEQKNDNFGFYWDFYAPYFIQMKNKKLIKTFAYIVFASSDSSSILKWLKANRKKTDIFFEWAVAFEWQVIAFGN